MLMLISQDGLKAIDTNKIDFYYIIASNNDYSKNRLMAKAPKFPAEEGYYDFLILFEHEDIDVVKRVMRFLANGQFFFPADDNSNLIVVDLPDLYKHGLQLKN